MDYRQTDYLRKNGFMFAIIGIVILTLMNSVFVVSPGDTVVIVRLGTIARTSAPGLNFKIPFIEQGVKFSTRIQKKEYSAGSASNDLQSVDVKVAHNFAIDKAYVEKLFRTVGKDVETRIIDPTVYEAVKSCVARYTAEELIKKRSLLRDEIKAVLKEKLSPYGVITEEVSIVDIDFSEQFDQAIEGKLVAEQNALKAKRDLDRIKTEAEQKIATAKAESTITPYMIQLRWIEKWNGVLPQTTGVSNLFYGIGK